MLSREHTTHSAAAEPRSVNFDAETRGAGHDGVPVAKVWRSWSADARMRMAAEQSQLVVAARFRQLWLAVGAVFA